MTEHTLLAVDDNLDNLYVLRSLIAQHLPECEVITAQGAEEGLQAASRDSFDGALIDVQMPGMSGIELCKRLKSDQRTARIPVILITAHHSDASLRAHALQAGADDFLSKPIDNLELIARIRVILRGKRSKDDLLLAKASLEQRVEEGTLALRGQEASFRALVESLPDIVIRFDRAERFLFVSRNFEEILSMPADRILGKTHQELAFPEPVCRFWSEGIRKVLEGAGLVESEFSLDGPHGPRLFDVRLVPERDVHGEIQTVLAISRDVTDHRQAEEARQKLQEQLFQAQKMESVGRLAGGVAHDLNNLLSPIIGYGELLLESTPPNEPRRRTVEEILRAGFRARDLVKQLMTFSRKQPFAYRIIDLGQVVSACLSLLRRTIREDIEIVLNPGQAPFPVRGDAGQIEQVLLNLAINAQDAMPHGGRLTIGMQPVELNAELIGNRPDLTPGRYVLLTVHDTGKGIPPEIRDRIFEPFFSTKGERGIGLGLASVYGIVQQHHGCIRVTSEPEKGATFLIHLPLSQETPAREPIPEPPKKSVGGSETILLVEDDDQLRVMVDSILRRHGYRVLQAEHGTRALQILNEGTERIHLLLTDVVMPGMNGRELFSQAQTRRPDLRVLFMSGYTGDLMINLGLAEDGPSFLQKPFSAFTLAAKVREILDRT